MKKYFFILLFIVGFFGILTVSKAQGVIGEGCEKQWSDKRFCDGNTVIKVVCKTEDCLAQLYAAKCDSTEFSCLSKCWDDDLKCKCQGNPNLGAHLRGTLADDQYMDCTDACDAKNKLCENPCYDAAGKCERDSHKRRDICETIFNWYKSGEEVCSAGKICVQNGDDAYCESPSTPAIGNKSAGDGLPDIADYIKCTDEALVKYGGKGHGYWGGCKYSPGYARDTEKDCPPEYIAALKECDRKYPIKNQPVAGQSAPSQSGAQETETPPGTFCKAVPTEQNNVDAVEKEDKNLQKALARLNKIKQSDDERATDHAIEDELALLDKDSKEKMEFIRGTADDIHEIASNGVGWQGFPETLESIKKGEAGFSYGKLELATDVIKSFNDYIDSRAAGATVEDAAAEALLNNFGATALTAIPVLGAIDLVAKTPSMILDIFDIDEKNWLRKNVTDGIIAKFSPSGVVEQTTELMLENDWSTIGGALSYQWGKVRSADDALSIAKESGKLVAGGIGAGAVSVARALRDTTAGTIFVGQKAVNCVSSWFGY